MSLLGGNDLKEQQKINELELKINREKQKLDKKLTRQKILLGAFLIETLEKNEVEKLREYVANNLDDFLTRESDRELMSDVIEKLKKISNKNNEIDYNGDKHTDDDTLVANIADTGLPVDEDNMFVED
ncbi:mobilization protein MobS [Jeotgalibacillus sp. S-D1]|uniref:mobilization protein MobS n=1 Tax=Psychrobacter sp. Cmf 22.2 TaxID=1926478 RepID=UPI000946EC09|nr:mobilization protein MobS [Psychrobacter sp. Cmf 22.2]OLF35476.1 mobilization protein MobS [Psychrobacter sp. Cmf 22.2]TDL30336.1 mobilization protein MobS [Jeotgalibacillus sp. S-D1]